MQRLMLLLDMLGDIRFDVALSRFSQVSMRGALTLVDTKDFSILLGPTNVARSHHNECVLCSFSSAGYEWHALVDKISVRQY